VTFVSLWFAEKGIAMIEQLAVFSENKLGRLERITRVLAEANVNIRAFHVTSLGEIGVVKIVVDQTESAYRALSAQGTVRKMPVVAVRVPDRPGALHHVTAVLAQAGINIENVSGFSINRSEAILILEVSDVPGAERILAEAEFKVLDEGEFEAAVG
jgi:hypothetical protein